MTDAPRPPGEDEVRARAHRQGQRSSIGGSEAASLGGMPRATPPPAKANQPQGTYTDAEIAQEIEELFFEDQFVVDELRFRSKIVFRTIQNDLKDEQVVKFAQKILTVLLREKDTNPKITQILADTDGIALR